MLSFAPFVLPVSPSIDVRSKISFPSINSHVLPVRSGAHEALIYSINYWTASRSTFAEYCINSQNLKVLWRSAPLTRSSVYSRGAENTCLLKENVFFSCSCSTCSNQRGSSVLLSVRVHIAIWRVHWCAEIWRVYRCATIWRVN